MNALADPRVADYLNENFICTFLKVGTFRIVNGQKQGGNVASYFCLPDGRVVHAVPGKIGADTLLSESRWAYEIRKSALTFATNLRTGDIDAKKYCDKIVRGHSERFHAETNAWHAKSGSAVPMNFPHHRSQQAQAHWLLATRPLADWQTVYPTVWTKILKEELSDAPVATR